MIEIDSIYNIARDLLMKLKKKNYFKEFSQQDIFYIDFLNEKDKMVLLFIDQFFGNSYGIQLFFTKKGFKYLHNIFTTPNPEAITIGDCDALFAIFKSKEELVDKDIEYLKKNNKRVKEQDNIIFYRFEEGYADRYANDNELDKFILAITFMLSLLKNDFKQIKQAFDDAYSVIAEVDTTKYVYETRYQDLPYLIKDPNNLKENKDFIQEFKNSKYVNDKIDFYTIYLPIKIKENNRRVLLNLIYYNKQDKYDIYFIKDKTTIKQAILGMFYETFNKYGLPLEINLCQIEYMTYIKKTMSKLNIEVFSDKASAKCQNIAKRISEMVFDLTNDAYFSLDDAMNLLNNIKGKEIDHYSDEDYENDDSNSTNTYIS